MNRRFRSLFPPLLVAAMMLATAAPALAGEPAGDAPAVRPLAAAFWTGDEWEDGAGDDSHLTAQDLDVAGLGALGADPVWQEHTFNTAYDQVGDMDWYKFQVTASDITNLTCFRIEARVETNQVDPCIEVYGPVAHGAAPGFTPTSPTAMATFPFAWQLDNFLLFANPACKDGSLDFVSGKDVRTGSIVFTPGLSGLSAGDYYIRVRPTVFWTWVGSPIPSPVADYGDKAGDYVFTMQRGGFERIEGIDRTDTAFLIAARSYNVYGTRGASTPDLNTSGNVVIANGWKFPDALAGAALCGALNAPLLLVQQDAIPPRTQDGLDMLGIRRAYVLGDPNSVSNDMMDEITSTTWYTARYFGANRYLTAVEIATRIKDMPGKSMSGVAFICAGDAWADALAAAPYSAWAGGTGNTITPILLTERTRLTTATANALTTLGITDVVIVGGTPTIDAYVETQLADKLGSAGHVLRLSGSNRYETALRVALWTQERWGPGASGNNKIGTSAAPDKLDKMTNRLEDGSNGIAVATGQNYPDALSGGAMCGRLGIPLLLTPTGSMSPYIIDPSKTSGPFNDYVRNSGFVTKHGWILGGTNAVSATAERSLDSEVSGQDWTP